MAYLYFSNWVAFLSRVGGTSMFSNQILEQKLFVIISMLLQIEQTLCIAGIMDDFVLGFWIGSIVQLSQKILQTGATCFVLD